MPIFDPDLFSFVLGITKPSLAFVNHTKAEHRKAPLRVRLVNPARDAFVDRRNGDLSIERRRTDQRERGPTHYKRIHHKIELHSCLSRIKLTDPPVVVILSIMYYAPF